MDTTTAIDPLFVYVAHVEAPRREPSTTLHALEAILLLPLLGTMCGAHNGVDIAPWGEARQAWLCEFLELPHGLPSPDTFGRVLALLDPARLPQALLAWRSALAQRGQESMTWDGTTMRRSLDQAEGKGPRHGVSAGASRKARGLAQCNVEATSTEITALPELLALRHLEGSGVTIDAMGGPVEVARQSIAQGGESVWSWTDNQPRVYEDGAELFTWRKGPHALDAAIVLGAEEQGDGGHGRVETRQGGAPPASMAWCPASGGRAARRG